jgi:hypothetical protein
MQLFLDCALTGRIVYAQENWKIDRGLAIFQKCRDSTDTSET